MNIKKISNIFGSFSFIEMELPANVLAVISNYKNPEKSVFIMNTKPQFTDAQVIAWQDRHNFYDAEAPGEVVFNRARLAMEDAFTMITPASPWSKVSDRMPTAGDADKSGMICCINENGDIMERELEDVKQTDLWISCPKAKPKPDFHRDFVAKLEGQALELWNLLGAHSGQEAQDNWEEKQLNKRP